MTTTAPASDNGTATAAIRVGARRRRNSAMVRITIDRLISRVTCTSPSEARMVGVPSKNGVSSTPGGRLVRICGTWSLMRSTVAITLAPDCLNTYIRIARWPLYQAAW